MAISRLNLPSLHQFPDCATDSKHSDLSRDERRSSEEIDLPRGGDVSLP